MQPKENVVDKINSILESSAEWAGKHLNYVLGAFLALLILGGVATGINYKNRKDEGKAMAEYAQLERDFTNWKLNQQPAEKKDKNTPQVNPQELYSKLAQFIQAQPDTKASQMAALMATELAQILGKESEILSLVESKMKLTGKSMLDGLMLIKKGDWLANEDKCSEAVGIWKQVTAKKSWPYLKDFAHLKSGLCFEKMNQFAEAESQYDQVLKAQDAKQDAWAYKEAQKLKRSLKWSQKQQGS